MKDDWTKNLLTETLEIMAEHGKAMDDVRWCVAYGDTYFNWSDFEKLANVNYDSGWGGNTVPLAAKVVGDDWWLERHEYDGSEWWEYKTIPVRPETYEVPGSLVNGD